MAWDYRMMEDEEGNICIHEVYYNASGGIEDWTKAAVFPKVDKYDIEDGRTMEDVLKLFMEATKKPVLQRVTGRERESDG